MLSAMFTLSALYFRKRKAIKELETIARTWECLKMDYKYAKRIDELEHTKTKDFPLNELIDVIDMCNKYFNRYHERYVSLTIICGVISNDIEFYIRLHVNIDEL
jgi:hypothetical protein